MRALYAPDHYYSRIRSFLAVWQPRGKRPRLTASDLRAFLRSLWALGLRTRGRRAFWRLFWGALLTRPAKFRVAMELAIVGRHFRIMSQWL